MDNTTKPFDEIFRMRLEDWDARVQKMKMNRELLRVRAKVEHYKRKKRK